MTFYLRGRDLAAHASASRIDIRYRTPPDIRLRGQRQCQSIWRRGARVVFELIEELHHHQDLGDDLDRRLERYAGLDPELVRVLGADRFTQAPLRTIAGGRR
jgi:hypothetical protein